MTDRRPWVGLFLVALLAGSLLGCQEEEKPTNTTDLIKEMKSEPSEAIPENEKIKDAITMGGGK